MRVLYLALQAPGLSPGQRYRVEAFLPSLRRRGIEVRYDWLLDRDDLRIFYGRTPLSQGAVAAQGRRCSGLAAWREPRAWMRSSSSARRSSSAAPGANGWQPARALIYDFDDAIWIRTTSDANRGYAWLKNVRRCRASPRWRDGDRRQRVPGGVGPAALARTSHVVPTCVDTDHFVPPPATRPRRPGDHRLERQSVDAGAPPRPCCPCSSSVVARARQARAHPGHGRSGVRPSAARPSRRGVVSRRGAGAATRDADRPDAAAGRRLDQGQMRLQGPALDGDGRGDGDESGRRQHRDRPPRRERLPARQRIGVGRHAE